MFNSSFVISDSSTFRFMLSATTPKTQTGAAEEAAIRDKGGLIATRAQPERAILAQLVLQKPTDPDATDEQSCLQELAGLAEAAGTVVAGSTSQKRDRPHAATLFGKGKVEELAQLCEEQNANVVIVDSDLTPAQGRNLESALERRVIDRTELILDIFARRAQTRQAKLQVELAQLRYQLPRLKRLWTHLDSQTGGGVGLRGPGETQLETDKRLAGMRIALLEKQLEEIKKQKKVASARRAEFPTAALVGYTNVGKSALLNTLASPFGKRVLEKDQLFATLGAATRKIELGNGREVLLSDTVGFVRRLPHNLVESFHSTLAEVTGADFLILVADGADAEFDEKLSSVRRVLAELETTGKPQILVLNQCDRLDDDERAALHGAHPEAILTSALTGEGLDELRARILELLEAEDREWEFELDARDAGKALSDIARHGRVLEQEWSTPDTGGEATVRVRASLSPRWLSPLHLADKRIGNSAATKSCEN
jgi:GTP-binding protein HflX